LDGDDNDDSGLSEEEAEAKAFEEIKRIFGLPDDFQDSNSESHKFWGDFAKELKKYCSDPKNKNTFTCKKKH
jgi:hypothetical protein